MRAQSASVHKLQLSREGDFVGKVPSMKGILTRKSEPRMPYFRSDVQFLSAPGASQTRRREICKHATVLQLAAGAEENVQFMGGYSLSNIAWACRTLDLGTPEFMNKVSFATTRGSLCKLVTMCLWDFCKWILSFHGRLSWQMHRMLMWANESETVFDPVLMRSAVCWLQVIHRFVEILPRMRDKEVNGTLAAFSKCGQLTAQNLDIITPYWLKWCGLPFCPL